MDCGFFGGAGSGSPVMKTFYGQFAETAPDWSCTSLMALLQNPTEPDPHGLREGS